VRMYVCMYIRALGNVRTRKYQHLDGLLGMQCRGAAIGSKGIKVIVDMMRNVLLSSKL
jgi:hypothetical protein